MTGVGIYREHVLPRLIDKACGTAELSRWRAHVTDGLTGTIVEIGFGSGLNLPSLPDDVTRIFAVEPASTAWKLAATRIGDSAVEVQRVGLRGEALPLDDDSCDGALSTFTLCTVAHPEQVLRELRRVLKPGGRLHFLEHGSSPDHSVARWQRRIEPVQKRLADGCHLTRDPAALVSAAGFDLVEVESRYAAGPKPWSWFTRGVGVNPPSRST